MSNKYRTEDIKAAGVGKSMVPWVSIINNELYRPQQKASTYKQMAAALQRVYSQGK